uniref:Uncharacterized protein n=1 Tax=Oryza glumipatula TaxID=40148 RepID=A0A0E0B6H1_9ORYZ
MIESSDVSIDNSTRNACLLPKLDDGCPTTDTLQLAHPTLSLMDAHIVYIMGKVDVSDEKALVHTVDMANKRLQEVSVYDAERIVNDFDYAYTHSTISQYFTTAAAGLKRNLKRPLKFQMQYPHKRQGGPVYRSYGSTQQKRESRQNVQGLQKSNFVRTEFTNRMNQSAKSIDLNSTMTLRWMRGPCHARVTRRGGRSWGSSVAGNPFLSKSCFVLRFQLACDC